MEYTFTFRIFEQLALALKNRGCPGIFHCIEYTFYIQNILPTCACPEKQRVPWIHCIECRFFIFRIFEQLALALKNRVALQFFTVLKYISLFRIFEQLENRVCPDIFQARGGAAALPDPRLVRLWVLGQWKINCVN